MDRPLFIKWQDRNNTGIALIDEQHRGIVSVINSFYYLIGQGVSNPKLYSCVSDIMKNYSRIHFITEEALLEEIGYKDIEKHKELHKKLNQEMERIEHDVLRSNDARLLLNFLKQWWLEHISEQDQRYARFLRESAGAR
jgi:hemerythrin-like metal-binding protein